MIDAVVIRRNTVFSFAAALIRMIATMLMFVGIARFFGPQAFGQFALAHTYLTIFYIIADFGIDILLMTELAYRREETAKYIQRFFSLKIILSLIAFGGMIGIALFAGVSAGTRNLMVILSAAILGNSAATFVLGILKGHEQFSIEATTSFWQNLILLAGLLVLGFLEADVALVAAFFVFSRFAGVFYVLPKAWSYLQQTTIQWSLREWRPAIKEAAPYGLHMLLGTLYVQLDTILISVWYGDTAVGLYQSAIKLVMLALVVSDVASNAFLPTFARLLREDEGRAIKAARLFAKILLYLGMPAASICFLYSRGILVGVYGGEEFGAAEVVLKILALTLFFRFATDAYAVMLTASGKQTRRAVISGVGTLVSLVLNGVLIPTLGIEGAAVASVCVHCLVGSFSVFFLDLKIRSVVFHPDMRRIAAILAFLLVAAILAALGIKSMVVGVAVIITSAIIVSWSIGMTREERSILLSLTAR